MNSLSQIAIVDDDQDDQELLKEALCGLKPELDFSFHSNGLELINWLHNAIALPSLVFLDINMPLCNGYDALKLIRNDPKFIRLPVVMYSTSVAPADILQAYEQGADMYLTKPYRVSDFEDKLKAIFKWLKEGKRLTLNDFVL